MKPTTLGLSAQSLNTTLLDTMALLLVSAQQISSPFEAAEMHEARSEYWEKKIVSQLRQSRASHDWVTFCQ